ncbi:MAG: lamin tail domain-containing protein [Nanoarchaeota archaeon]
MRKKQKIMLSFFISFIFLSLVVLSSGFVSSEVFINEVEVNPFGSDSGNEWAELYNDGNAVNITGWFIQDVDGVNYSISGAIIEQNSFYVLDSLSGLNNVDQNITLFRTNGFLEDTTGNFSDSDNDDLTLSRIPDGSGGFSMENSTKGISNQLIIISDQVSTSCNIKGKNVILSAMVNGFCVEDVIFSVETDNGWVNFTGSSLNGLNYSVSLNTSLLNISQSTNWNVYVRDCYNRTANSGIESFYVNEATLLIINPSEPDGKNNWYISEPLFTLINLDVINISYRWDNSFIFSTNESVFGPFGLENVPNNGNVSAGNLELNYWGDLVCIEEPKRTKNLLIDLTDPLIKDMLPINNSMSFDRMPLIYAYVDEIYQSNSGINKTSIVLKIDNDVVNSTVQSAGTLDVKVEYTSEENLSFGNHTINLYVEDKAGRNSSMMWNFEVVEPYLNITINSPLGENYDERRIQLNISLEGEAALIQYINHNDRSPRYKRLCNDCNGYGNDRKKEIFFNEGWNNITVQAVGSLSGGIVEKEVAFFIDSIDPRVSSTYPTNNKLTNGSLFKVRYSEDNLDNITLIINNYSETKYDCVSGRSKECNFSVNFSEITNETQTQYYFEIADLLHIVRSRLVRIYIDDTSPTINVTLPQNITYIDRRIPINITTSENVILQYKDLRDVRPITRRLCSNCMEYGNVRGKTSIFRSGPHELEVKAIDRAGNSATTIVAFSVA